MWARMDSRFRAEGERIFSGVQCPHTRLAVVNNSLPPQIIDRARCRRFPSPCLSLDRHQWGNLGGGVRAQERAERDPELRRQGNSRSVCELERSRSGVSPHGKRTGQSSRRRPDSRRSPTTFSGRHASEDGRQCHHRGATALASRAEELCEGIRLAHHAETCRRPARRLRPRQTAAHHVDERPDQQRWKRTRGNVGGIGGWVKPATQSGWVVVTADPDLGNPGWRTIRTRRRATSSSLKVGTA